MVMKEINYDFSREKARNNQHVNFATNALAAFPEEVAEAQGFAELRTAFAAAVDDEVLCFQPDKSYMDTPEVEETDLTRDSTFMFYKHIALAYADYCPDAEKRKHGKTLAFAFDNEGDVTRAEYTGETAMLADLADKLRQEPYAAALTALGIDDAPDQIDAANDAFNQVYMRRAAEMEGRRLQRAGQGGQCPLCRQRAGDEGRGEARGAGKGDRRRECRGLQPAPCDGQLDHQADRPH